MNQFVSTALWSLCLTAGGLLALPHKPSTRLPSPHTEGTSPAPLVTTETPNTTEETAPNPPSVVSSLNTGEANALPDRLAHATESGLAVTGQSRGGSGAPPKQSSGAGETGAGDSYSKFENESLRKERDELLATVADLREQVKRLQSYTVQPVRSVPQPDRYTMPAQYGSCSGGSCGPSRGGFRPVRRLFGR